MTSLERNDKWWCWPSIIKLFVSLVCSDPQWLLFAGGSHGSGESSVLSECPSEVGVDWNADSSSARNLAQGNQNELLIAFREEKRD